MDGFPLDAPPIGPIVYDPVLEPKADDPSRSVAIVRSLPIRARSEPDPDPVSSAYYSELGRIVDDPSSVETPHLVYNPVYQALIGEPRAEGCKGQLTGSCWVAILSMSVDVQPALTTKDNNTMYTFNASTLRYRNTDNGRFVSADEVRVMTANTCDHAAGIAAMFAVIAAGSYFVALSHACLVALSCIA